MAVKALDIPVIQIPVRNVEKSVAWYQEVLGLGITFDYSAGDHEAWLNVNGGIGFGLVECSAPDLPKLHFINRKEEVTPLFTFRVDNIYSAHRELTEKGIEVSEMKFKEGGGYGFTFVDPDGHVFYSWGGWPNDNSNI